MTCELWICAHGASLRLTDLIRIRRASRSFRETAREAGCNHQLLHAYEIGQYLPSVRTLPQLLKWIGVESYRLELRPWQRHSLEMATSEFFPQGLSQRS